MAPLILLVALASAQEPPAAPAGEAPTGEEAPETEAASTPASQADPAPLDGPDPALDALVARFAAMGWHREAYRELARAAALAADPEAALALELRAGATLWDGERWGDAALHFQALAPPGADGPDNARQEAARLGQAYSLYKKGETLLALQPLAGLRTPEAAYLAGWCHLDQRDVELAVRTWDPLVTDPEIGLTATVVSKTVAGWQRVPYRSPRAAGVLSAALPGAGQAYAGRWGEATSSLVVNGLLIAAGVQLARRELWFGAGLVALFELGFYGGNIMGAVNGARRFNESAWDELVAPLAPYEPALEVEGAALELAL